MKVGVISYSNSWVFSNWLSSYPIDGVEIVHSYPSDLNQRLYEGELALSSISAYEYLLHHDRYQLLEGLSINSLGFVRSVLLFCRRPLEELKNRKIACSDHSATSAMLLRLILKQKKIEPKSWVQAKDGQDVSDADALLLIGDAALAVETGRFPYVYDLAQLWKELTQLPVVFALWAVNKKDLLSSSKQINLVHQELLNARDHFSLNKKDWARAAQKHFASSGTDFDDYYDHLDFSLNKDCRSSLKLYAQELADLKLLSSDAASCV